MTGDYTQDIFVYGKVPGETINKTRLLICEHFSKLEMKISKN